MEEIKDYIDNGLISQLFEAKLHLKIYTEIANHVPIIKKRSKETIALFSYVQKAAQQNMVLKTARIFDNENKRYPTRCMQSLFSMVKKKEIDAVISNDYRIREYLNLLNAGEIFNESLEGSNSKEFLLRFITHCEELINSTYKDDIETIKMIRDKYIAHNEAKLDTKQFDPQTIERLANLALNIALVIECALFGDMTFLMDESVDKSSYFIKRIIKELKTSDSIS